VGAGATLFAMGWYFFAPKAQSAEPHGAAHLTPSIGPRGEPGASFEVSF
jgi:hypothetical protein